MNHPSALVAALLITGLSFSATARAEASNLPSRHVSAAGLDLSTPAGLKAYERRIEKAANALCVDASGPAPAGRVDPLCKRDALNEARRQLDTVRTHKF